MLRRFASNLTGKTEVSLALHDEVAAALNRIEKVTGLDGEQLIEAAIVRWLWDLIIERGEGR